jgi:putative addiction module CopG family antidote
MSKVTTLSICIPPDLVRFIRERVESGRYSSASDVICDGLRVLQSSVNGASRGNEDFDRARVAAALDGLRKISSRQTLGDELTSCDLIDEGSP